MQPLNQPIEMIDRERQSARGAQWAKRIARLTGDEWQATFSFRAGFASRPAPPSPRRRLRDVVLEGPMLGPIWPAGFVPGSVTGVDGGIRRG